MEISSEPIGIAKVVKRINAATEKNIRNISGAKIAAWLVKKGYLTLEVSKQKKYLMNIRAGSELHRSVK